MPTNINLFFQNLWLDIYIRIYYYISIATSYINSKEEKLLNRLKKIVSSMLATLMLLSLSANISFASIAQDVRNTEYETEAKVLGGLGIMVGDADTGNFRPNDAIKRSEATKIAVALSALSGVASQMSQNTSYPDVSKDYWANGFINAAKAHGLVIGDDKGNFRAEDQINFGEMVTILIRALGYEVQALAKGGYPMGYIATASSIGLTKGISASADRLISRGDVATMAYNALTINLMEQTGFGSNVDYQVTNKTLLKDKLGVTLIKGKVNAVGASVIDGGAALSKDEIRIGDKNYNTGKTDIRTILGFNAEAYLNDKTKTIVAVVPVDGANRVITVNAENIAGVENTLSAKSLEYWNDKDTSTRTVKANIENDAFVIYNGKLADFGKFTKIDSGYISLLDSNSNGRYDIVFVNETINYVIDDIYTTSQKITDKYGNPTLTLDFEDDSKTVIIEKANESITLSDLKEWDVISFTISEDEDIIFGNAVRSSVEGSVTEISDEYIYIGEQKFLVADNYPNSFSLGDEGIFYIDYEGKIAAFNGQKSKNAGYAYLNAMNLSSGINKEIKFELFTSEGKLEVLKGAKKITVNSSRGLSADAVINAVGSSGKLISFEKNSAGEISKIITSTQTDDINENIFTLNMTDDDAVYRASSSKLTGDDMSIIVSSDTLIFDIPEGADKEDYAVRGRDFFSDGGKYAVMVYDVSETHRAGAIVVTSSASITAEESDIAIVDKVTAGKNSNGDNIHKLYALSAGKSVELTSKNDTVLLKPSGKLIKEGDIIQLRTNSKGEIDAIKVLFDTEAQNAEAKTEISDKLTTIFGKVTKKFSDSINVQIGEAKAENYEISKATVYVYDKDLKKNKVRTGTLADIERYNDDGSKIFMRIYNHEVKEIVVIK